MKIKNVKVGFLQTNCYIVEKDDFCLIIDPGDESCKIDEAITCKPIAILLTHCHFDHVGALDDIKNKYNIPVYSYDNLKEGIISIEPFNLEVIYTKGHTSDSVTYYFKDDKVMFTGDFLFNGAIGRTDLPTGNDDEMRGSIKKIIQYDDDIKIYPGHDESSTLGNEKKNNIYLK